MTIVGIDITKKDIGLLLVNLLLGVPVGVLLGWSLGRQAAHDLHQPTHNLPRGRETPDGPRANRDMSGDETTGIHHPLTGQAPEASTGRADLSEPPAAPATDPRTEIRALVDQLHAAAASEVLAYVCWVLGEGRLVPPEVRLAGWRDLATEQPRD